MLGDDDKTAGLRNGHTVNKVVTFSGKGGEVKIENWVHTKFAPNLLLSA